MSRSIRWVHLSDFHFGTDNYGEASLAESIIEHIKHRCGELPDLVFLTGDIAFSGSQDQYEQFNQQFLKPLIELLGEDAASRVFSVPGNHDLNRKTNDLILRSALQEKRLRFFDPTGEGLNQRKDIIERFESYIYSCDVAGEAWIESKEGVYIRQLDVSGVKVGLLGLNTAWHCQDTRDCNEITPGANLVKEGLKVIAECSLRVVLGHHPIEWFMQNERSSIERLFREHRVVYLHGHLHKSEAQWKGWPDKGFLTMQAGAAFQMREDEKWKNRILYAEADLATGKLWVEPFTWSRKEGWVPEGGDAFPADYYEAGRWGLPLPNEGNKAAPSCYTQSVAPPKPPEGWQLLDTDFLMGLQSPDRATVLAYYDGRIPSWSLALSPDVPQRAVVAKLLHQFLDHQSTGKAAICLLSGAGGEGKTTATMQIAAMLAEQGWQVLWRRSEIKGLPLGFVNSLPDGLGPWLIATDDADAIANDLYQNARSGLPHVHFLLAARDTDWSAGSYGIQNWSSLPGFHTEFLNGLDVGDARLIVGAWARYGKDGLGDQVNTPLDEAARLFADAAQDQNTHDRHEGAFLGAMLKLRKGTELREHVASLLIRLNARPIPHRQGHEGKTLLDALAYIAAMHSENLLFLSKPVLAKVLGCKLSKLRSDVLRPLGEEAAADSFGRVILIRHRSIAEAAIDILQQRFHFDIQELYVEMARAARQIFLERDPAFGPVPEISKWNFISDHFFGRGDEELGVRLAMNLVDVEPSNPYLISKLAQLYRRYDQPKEAVKVFRESERISEDNRAFYSEWAACEGNSGNHALNIWLDGLSLSDQAERKRLTSDQTGIPLAGFSLACRELFLQRPDERVYIDGCGAAAQLGLKLSPRHPQTMEFLEANMLVAKQNGVTAMTHWDALEVVKNTLALAWQNREADLPDWVPHQDHLGFAQLAMLLGFNH